MTLVRYEYVVSIKYKRDAKSQPVLRDELVVIPTLQGVLDKLYCFVGSAKQDIESVTIVPRETSEPV